ncbi:uncharacterized protein LOC18432735 isoform X1 [Amborella trichopoda]|uniref:uncharacterized protein LOC18432735 isoform X1 n=1 Tax=Amborella trichopoda TaxID=13333 RepID=UPI0009C0D9C3|nr:uncharacterized protein LOC18432735 isoform X1 [Amborella trichopoda]|eukprot:XP_011622819.2 uncharacterized protein LOC18432735 isoform X1 [Amborella trichopoda]
MHFISFHFTTLLLLPLLFVPPHFQTTPPNRHNNNFQMALLCSPPEMASSFAICPKTSSCRRSKRESKSRNGVNIRVSLGPDCRRLGSSWELMERERVDAVQRELGMGILGEVFVSQLNLLSSVQYEPPSSKQKEGGDNSKQDYYVNLGYAIRTLREDLPEIFYREPSFNIYRDDIVFKDRLNTFGGIDNYKLIFRALRFYGRIFFKALWIDLHTVWQPVESTIMIRWTVHGIPRVPWESQGRFDGTSEYKLDKDGKIYEHRVDNFALNSPPKFRVLGVEELIQALGCPSTPKPTYFEIIPVSFTTYMSYFMWFTWVRYYLALCITLCWICAVA